MTECRSSLRLPHARLRERFGSALQRQRQERGITQGKLAEVAHMSTKYIGEIERGEANVSIDLQERLCVALEWYPFELWVSKADTLDDPTRAGLTAHLQHIVTFAQASLGTLQAMDAASGTAAEKPKRGRPRRLKPPDGQSAGGT